MTEPYFPQAIFAPGNRGPVRSFIAPQRYVQGPGALDELGRYLALLKPSRAAVLLSAGGERRFGERIDATLESHGIASIHAVFGGECALSEIEAHSASLAPEGVECLLAVGGGKCVDAGKAIAWRLDVPVVIVPTLASNDAPCSALSVLYTDHGVSSGVEFYPCSPAIVLVDTEIVAAASERFLVAGMGDAMATWYEARVCLENPNAVTTVGSRPTIASAAIGEACARTLFADGEASAAAVRANRVDEALERVVEANTLLSGLGFESGGLAGAHGLAQSFTAIPSVHANFLHGEMVAMGTLMQLMLEQKPEEATEVARFFARVGLPVHLGQVGLAATDEAAVATLVDGTLAFPFLANLTVDIGAASVRTAILAAHDLGVRVAGEVGDEAYRRLQA